MRRIGLLCLGALAGCAEPVLPEAPEAGTRPALVVDVASQRVTVTDPSPTVSVLWDRAFQEAVLEAEPGPPVTARAAAILHTAMFDVWAAYDPVATATSVGDAFQRPPEDNTDALKAEAMSHAAYVLLRGMFPASRDRFDRLMDALGYDKAPGELNDRPAGLARVIASRVMAGRRSDNSNWDDGFEDTTGYRPANPHPLALRFPDRWTPESTPVDPEDADPEQEFIVPQWSVVRPFALASPAALRPRPPEPFFVAGLSGEVDLAAREIVLADGARLAAEPALIGPVVNPAFVAQAERVVDASAALTDRQKLIAEFWEDAKDTAFPPGTWLAFAQYVSARDDHTIDQDAVMFFLMANAQLDASIAVWEAKVHYDYARPVRAIRTLGRLGLIGEDGQLRAWAGPGAGVREVEAARWLPYQRPDGDPSPPFAEYPSGHSAFSAAGAAVLEAVTGSPRFGGAVTFPAGSSRFEPGLTPAAPVTLRWETFRDAADEAGLSRIYGGIHFDDGDLEGRALGRAVARAVLAKGRAYVEGRAR
ncbi:MAG: vanadium-dependent haloperoxidase [Paracoccaceae bacterium]